MARKNSVVHTASTPTALIDTIGLAKRFKHPSPRTLERWRTNGFGPVFVKIGRRVLYRESDVEAWLDRQTRSHTGQTRPEPRRAS